MKNYQLLIAPAVGWLLAQSVKFVLFLRKDGFQLRDLYASGGFPSAHTATIVPVVVLLALTQGLDDPVFALSAIMAGLVMYDSVGVRRSTGQNTAAIKELANKTSKTLTTKLYRAKGHTPVEVAGGFVLGVLVGFAFYFA